MPAQPIGKPHVHLHRGMYAVPAQLLRFVNEHQIKTVNVAGSRASKEPEIYQFVKRILEDAFFPRPNAWIGGPDEG
jgi:Circularly permutated YpsA SLOG family